MNFTNSIIISAQFPKIWKIADVDPTDKANNPKVLSDLKLISILSEL